MVSILLLHCNSFHCFVHSIDRHHFVLVVVNGGRQVESYFLDHLQVLYVLVCLKAISLVTVALSKDSGALAVKFLLVVFVLFTLTSLAATTYLLISGDSQLSFTAAVITVCSDWIVSLFTNAYNTFPVLQRALQVKNTPVSKKDTAQYSSATRDRLLLMFNSLVISPAIHIDLSCCHDISFDFG
eukprot:TRINITY_DN5583_c0_g2_i1.p1 TRINITY_DN5583_c0_g2~~TRINITY_DN5583_c0_g2_i1.p1  ORF type:complete len:184 (-),score=34.11 TRINITY_DN5583_c0_g2_i1:236-787(-)